MLNFETVPADFAERTMDIVTDLRGVYLATPCSISSGIRPKCSLKMTFPDHRSATTWQVKRDPKS